MKKLLFVPALILLVGAGYLFLLKVGKISCKTQYGPCPPAIVSEVEKLKGKSIYVADRELRSLLVGREGVESYFTQFKLPTTLEVVVKQAKPEFALHYRDRQAAFLVDAEGRVLGIEKSADLPQIVSDREPKNTGERVSPEELFALGVVKDVFFTYNISLGILEGDTLKLDLGKVFVWFPTRGEKDLLLASLKLILAEIEGKPEQFARSKPTIDLRFKNPVVR